MNTPTLRAVLTTYTSRKWLTVGVGVAIVGFCVFGYGGGLAYTQREPIVRRQVLQFCGSMGALLIFIAAGHAKWQFVNPRARLLPGYTSPHLAWLATCLLVCSLLMPLVLCGLAKLPLHGTLLYFNLLIALGIWAAQTMLPVLSLFFFAVMMSPYLPGPMGQDIYSSSPVPWAWGVIGCCTIAQALWLRRLTQMTEADDDYLIPVYAQVGKLSRMEKSEARRLIARVASRNWLVRLVSDPWHDRIEGLPVATLAQRQKLLQYGFAMMPFVVPISIGTLVFILASLAIQKFGIPRPNQDGLTAFASSDNYWLAGVYTALIPAMMFAQLLAMRRPQMERELLLPLSREDYLGGLFREIGRDACWNWGVTSLGIIGLAALLNPAGITVPNVVNFLLASFAGVALTLAGCLRASRHTSAMARLWRMMPMLFLAIGAAEGSCMVGLKSSLLLPVALNAAILALAWWVLRGAYRKWLEVELG